MASITDRPVPESMSISWIFTPVGTISWGKNEIEIVYSGFDSIGDAAGDVTSRDVFLFLLRCVFTIQISIFDMTSLALAEYFEIL